MATITFGTEVSVTGYYRRVMDGNRRYWRAIGFHADGILIGKRTLWNGTVYTYSRYGEVDDYGDYAEFSRGEKVEAYLVAFPNCNPLYIPIEHVFVIVHSHTDDYLDIRE